MSIMLLRTTTEAIPYQDDFMDYLQWFKKYGFVVASNKLQERVGVSKKIKIEQYAYNKGYTYRSTGGLLKLNTFKEISC